MRTSINPVDNTVTADQLSHEAANDAILVCMGSSQKIHQPSPLLEIEFKVYWFVRVNYTLRAMTCV